MEKYNCEGIKINNQARIDNTLNYNGGNTSQEEASMRLWRSGFNFILFWSTKHRLTHELTNILVCKQS